MPMLNKARPFNWFRNVCVLMIATIAFNAQNCSGHGRLIEPPSRASAWRYGFQTPPDYNDHELYCGGFTRQWKRNDGKCGECGDAWDVPQPRPHEDGGQWGQGVIVRKYNPGAEMTIRIELTASHMGYFEFRLCPEPNAKQECLDRYLLRLIGGSPAVPAPNDLDTRFYPRNGSRIYEIRAQLPEDIECSNCMLQWRYRAGNNWGICPDGNGAVGCGPQEEFRSCSDIAIGEGAPTTVRPLRPIQRTTLRTNITYPTHQEDAPKDSSYVSIIIGLLLLIFVGGIAAAWHLYRYRRQKLLAWIEIAAVRICRKEREKAAMVSTSPHASIVAASTLHATPTSKTVDEKNTMLDTTPPVPPPRTKRQPRFEDILPNTSSIA